MIPNVDKIQLNKITIKVGTQMYFITKLQIFSLLKTDEILTSSDTVDIFVTKIINKTVDNAATGIIQEFVTKSKKSNNVMPNG